MNSFIFLSVMIGMSLLVGFILATDTAENTYHTYAYTKLKGYDDLRDSSQTAMDSSAHAAGEYSMDTTVGDTNLLTTDLWAIFNYGFNPFIFPVAGNIYEGFLLTAFGIYKSLIYAYTALLVFMIYKNKKTI